LISQSLSARLRRRRGIGACADEENAFWALRDINFEVEQGEVLGIIGRNGAGKSTLLKILSRITAPARGRVTLRGRMASLLEVGTGFHPELSGRENIFLNGSILGMHRPEIARNFDKIVDFAGVEKFIDTPVKRYSSGMYIRLAFAVAAHLRTDILVVDEVLAVGDSEFQKKCLGTMSDVSRSGRTVLVVSHNSGVLADICHTALLLDAGRMVFAGDIQGGLRRYAELVTRAGAEGDYQFQGPLKTDLAIDSIRATQDGEAEGLLVPGKPLCLEVCGRAQRLLGSVDVVLGFYSGGQRLFTLADSSVQSLPIGPFRSTFIIPAYALRPGRYSLAVGARRPPDWMWASDVKTLDIAELWDGRCRIENPGVVQIDALVRRQTAIEEGFTPASDSGRCVPSFIGT
jgi:lipopolysaccharide transport system ATP-binding protein